MPELRNTASHYMLKLRSAQVLDDVEAVLAEFAEAATFKHFFLRAVVHRGAASRTLKLGHYPEAWLARYASQNYAALDPAVAHARHYAGPLLLIETCREEISKPRLAGFLEDAYSLGLHEGLTIPLSSPQLWGYLNFHAPKSPKHIQAVALRSFLFAAHVVEAIVRVTPHDGSRPYDRLSKRERQVLYWASSGKTAWETGGILGITERTVVAHLTHAMATLGCTNKTQAVSAVTADMVSDLDLMAHRAGF